MWAGRLHDEPRFRAAVEELWPFALGIVEPELRAELGRRVGLEPVAAQRARRAHAGARRALGADDRGAADGTGLASSMVTVEQVWAALEEIPDPEIPVISLVDLGVIRDVAVDGAQVQIELTPTFLGCPALDAMRRALEQSVAALGGEADVRVITGRLVVDRQDHPGRPREAARGRLRAARAARGRRAEARPAPGPRLPLPLLRLHGDAAREPLRPDAVPLDPLLRRLPPAVRAVQDDLVAARLVGDGLTFGSSTAPSEEGYDERAASLVAELNGTVHSAEMAPGREEPIRRADRRGAGLLEAAGHPLPGAGRDPPQLA